MALWVHPFDNLAAQIDWLRGCLGAFLLALMASESRWQRAPRRLLPSAGRDQSICRGAASLHHSLHRPSGVDCCSWATETSGFRPAGRRCGLAGLDKLPPTAISASVSRPPTSTRSGQVVTQRTRPETAALQHAASRRRSLICCFFLFARDLHGKLESGGF